MTPISSYWTFSLPISGLVDEDVYARMAPSYDIKGQIMKLNKSLYGLPHSGKNWFGTTESALLHIGFARTRSHPCSPHTNLGQTPLSHTLRRPTFRIFFFCWYTHEPRTQFGPPFTFLAKKFRDSHDSKSIQRCYHGITYGTRYGILLLRHRRHG